MDIINFRKDALDKLKILADRYIIGDAKIPYLALLVYPSGMKTFILNRKVKGRSQRLKIGRYPEITIEVARKEATRLNAQIALGGDPLEERKAKRNELSFIELFELYYNEHASRFNKNAIEDKKMLERHFFPTYGKDNAGKITSQNIRRLHAKLGETYPIAANRTIALVSAVYNFGEKHKYYKGENPCVGLTKFKGQSRDRFLYNEELADFFTALQLEDTIYQDYFSTLLYTGARKANTLSMRWSDIDIDLKRWRLPGSKTKNKDVNISYFPKPVLEILIRRKEENKKSKTPSLFVFPGNGKCGHLKDPKKAFHRIRERMNVFDIRIHDLRRTLGSYMAISGASLPIIGKALNHKSQDSTAIYARLSQAPVNDAINTAVNMMIGNNIFSLYRMNMELLAIIPDNQAFKFSDLIAA